MIRLPQTMRPLIKALAVAVFAGALASCSTSKKSEQQKGYGRLLKCIKPGMYRRQLYAVLPPMEKPMATPPMMQTLPFSYLHTEKHRLDAQHFIEVTYFSTDATHAQAAFPKTGRESIKVDSIDELVRELSNAQRKPYASPENPNDVIRELSKVQHDPPPDWPFTAQPASPSASAPSPHP